MAVLRLRWPRRSVGAYLTLFFVAAVSAPHYHLNGLEDLLLDQRSNSGILTDAAGVARRGAPFVAPLRLVEDVPCLACFTRDFVYAPAPAVGFGAVLAPLALRSGRRTFTTPELLPADTTSRGPPALA